MGSSEARRPVNSIWNVGPKPVAGKDAGVLLSERAFVDGIRRTAGRQASRLAGQGVLRLGIGDDCAIIRPSPGDEMIVTTDLFLEQVHFRRDWHQPEVAGHRCLARGLSDIAAMAGTPVAALLSFALPPELTGDWARRFLDGLLRLARLHNVPLAGGDTAEAAPITLPQPRRIPPGNPAGRSTHSPVAGDPTRSLFAADIVLVGRVPRGKALLRSGAQVGDSIYVTGALGGAAAELAMLELAPGSYARKRRDRSGHPHLFPQPRITAGRFLLGRATAAIDLSDGLSTDLAHLCAASGVAAQIDASLLPIHHLAARQPDLSLDRALHGGEDYELLFTAPARRRFPAEFDGTPIHRIGAIVASGRGHPRITLLRSDGSRIALRNRGWEHFRKSG